MGEGILICLFILCGCTSVSKTVLIDNLPPVSSHEVQVFFPGDEVPPHSRVAFIAGEGADYWSDRAQLLRRLRETAGKLGANGVIVQAVEESSGGEKLVGALTGFGSSRKQDAIAILILPVEEGSSSNRLDSESSGSGVIVSSNGHILTNNHVIRECDEILVGPSSVPARVVGQDDFNDLALLVVENSSNVPNVNFRSESLNIGENVIAVGFPLKGVLGGITVTAGEVSAESGIEGDSRYVQISAPVQSGNSGGPLLDKTGQMVGLVTATLNPAAMAQLTGNLPQNVNFAIRNHVITQFLSLHDVSYSTTDQEADISTEVIADQASKYTHSLSCTR